jgi:hypothetical protein
MAGQLGCCKVSEIALEQFPQKSPASDLKSVYRFCFALNLAHLARCAAAILALLFADIFRRLRVGLVYAPAKAVSAASIPARCRCIKSFSAFSSLMSPEKSMSP